MDAGDAGDRRRADGFRLQPARDGLLRRTGNHLITGLNDGTALVWDLARVLARKREER